MSISYNLNGRFGNNLFQYFATKVISKYTNKKYVYNTYFNRVIGDEEFKVIYESCIEGSFQTEDDLYLNGYFQTDFWIIKEKEFLQSLLTIDNIDRINKDYTIKDIVLVLYDFSLKELVLNPSSLTVHIRLDDFYHQGYNSEVLDPDFLIEYINSVILDNNIKNCIFIVDILKEDWEKNYINKLLTIPNSVIMNNDILTDFSLLFYSYNLMLCKSTFGWISSACSKYNKNIWLPINKSIHSHQVFNTLGENTITFTPTYMTSGGRNY